MYMSLRWVRIIGKILRDAWFLHGSAVEADPSRASRGSEPSDAISMLVSIYGSKELFINEYRWGGAGSNYFLCIWKEERSELEVWWVPMWRGMCDCCWSGLPLQVQQDKLATLCLLPIIALQLANHPPLTFPFPQVHVLWSVSCWQACHSFPSQPPPYFSLLLRPCLVSNWLLAGTPFLFCPTPALPSPLCAQVHAERPVAGQDRLRLRA